MTRPWKLKRNFSKIPLVFIILMMLTKGEWTNAQFQRLDNDSGKISGEEISPEKIQIIVGREKIARHFFRSSKGNDSLPLDNVNRCLEFFQLVTCLKLLLLTRLDEAIEILKEPEMIKTDFNFLNGFISFNYQDNDSSSIDSDRSVCDRSSENGEEISLNGDISHRLIELFRNRSLRINLLPDYKVDLVPVAGTAEDNLMCFGYKLDRGKESNKVKGMSPSEKIMISPRDGGGNTEGEESQRKSADLWEGRKKKRKKGGIPMLFMLPKMLMLGLMPFTLASIKALVMNSLFLNTMALNGAIFMTIRNLVFGPKKGDNLKYVNYGYSKNRQVQPQRPVLIIHSPAAFINRPPYRQEAKHHHHSIYPPQSWEFEIRERSQQRIREEEALRNHHNGFNSEVPEVGENGEFFRRRQNVEKVHHRGQNGFHHRDQEEEEEEEEEAQRKSGS